MAYRGEMHDGNKLTGIISSARLLGGQVQGIRGYKGEKGDKGDTGDSGVTDVKIDGTSVVASGIATIPKADANQFGLVKIEQTNGEPPIYYLKMTSSNGQYQIPLMLNGQIKPLLMPEATTTTRGAMSATDKTKLDGIATGAEANVQANWSESSSSSDAYIQNKPTIPSKVSDLTNDSGFLTLATLPVWNGGVV
jgi:hypothetical protein